MAIVKISAENAPDPNAYITNNLFRAPVWYGDLVVAEAGTMGLIGSNGYAASYTGEFTYSSTGRASGVVLSFAFAAGAEQTVAGAYSGSTRYTISEINGTDGVAAKKLYEFAINGDSTSALKYLLARDDVIYGTGFHSFSIDEILYGWGGKDRIFGIDGDDVLGGGAGRDMLSGGNGLDYFFFDSVSRKDGDKILDFGFGGTRDKIVLLQSAFGDLALGALAADQFVAGSAALDANDRIIFNGRNISFDADGSGSGKAVIIAQLTYAEVLPVGIAQLSAADVQIVDSIENIVPLVAV